ncbi:MAG: hypothetical protein IMY85_10040 [Chloroflexi bacterium]|nr:hypothetical protein [Chloroflexota bacterium]
MRNKMKIPRGWIIGLAGAVFVAAALKVGLLLAGAVPFNADEAIVALMARHILEGERPVFFYGQSYMGSLDAYLISGMFKLIGNQVWGVRFVQIGLYSLTIITTALLGKQLTGKWKVGVLAAWFLALPNISTTLYTTVSMGGYGEMLLIGNLILLTTLKIVRDLSNSEEKISFIPWFGLGFLSGFGLWVFGLTLVYSIPAFIYLFWHCTYYEPISRLSKFLFPWRRNTLFNPDAFEKKEPVYQSKFWGAALIGGIFGVIPWLAYAQRTGHSNLLLELSGSAVAGVESLEPFRQILRHVQNLSLFGTTVIFGLRPPWEIRWLALPLAPFVLIFWIGVIVFAAKKTKSDIQLNPRDADYSHAPLLSGVVLMVVIGFILSPFGADPSGRYFLPVGVVMAIFAAQAVWKWHTRWGSYVWIAVGVVLCFHLWGTIQVARNYPPGMTTQFDAVTQIDHQYDQELIEFLQTQGETRGYTTYWVAYPLAFLSDEGLVYVPKLPYHQDLRYTSRDNRYQPYDQLVNQSDRTAYITTDNPLLNELLRKGFSELGVRWKETTIGDYQVYYQLSRRVNPEEISLRGGEG